MQKSFVCGCFLSNVGTHLSCERRELSARSKLTGVRRPGEVPGRPADFLLLSNVSLEQRCRTINGSCRVPFDRALLVESDDVHQACRRRNNGCCDVILSSRPCTNLDLALRSVRYRSYMSPGPRRSPVQRAYKSQDSMADAANKMTDLLAHISPEQVLGTWHASRCMQVQARRFLVCWGASWICKFMQCFTLNSWYQFHVKATPAHVLLNTEANDRYVVSSMDP